MEGSVVKCEKFRPAKGLGNAHLQTIFPALMRKVPKPRIEQERFELSDGDVLECYWHRKPEADLRTPVVTLFHGLEGSFDSSYIQGMMQALGRAGYSSVLMHFRGCAGKPNRLPRSYHSGDTADAAAWLESLRDRYPHAPLYAIGYSLGGNMLLKLLGEQGGSSLLSAAVSVSAPLQLDISARRMEQGLSRFYQWYLLRSLKSKLAEKYRSHPMESLLGADLERIGRIGNFYTFDTLYTAPIHGFVSAEEYYRSSSARQFLNAIKTPVLIIQAEDDPFMTREILPEPSELSESIRLEIYPHGGHVGFVAGTLWRPEYWLEKRILAYIEEQQSSAGQQSHWHIHRR